MCRLNPVKNSIGKLGESLSWYLMKVLQVNKLYYPHIGGIENHVRILATGLRNKIDVEVLVANERFAKAVEVIDGVNVTRVASLGRFRSTPVAPQFITQLKKTKSDVYHLHFPNPTGELSFLAARPYGKLVVTYHSDIVRQKNLLKLYKPFLEKFLDRADKIIAGSPNLIESSPFLQEVKEKCIVVPFGIPTGGLTLTTAVEEKVASIRKRHGSKIAFFLGRLIYYKGVEYLVEAIQDVEGKLIIAGDGELKSDLLEMVKKLSIEDRVEFVGTLSDEEVAAYYHACDVFVLPSIESSEAYGLVQLEAHACGKPVISTNLPTGVPFVNEDGISGIVVPPKDSESLSDAINKLFKDEELRNRLGAQAKQRFQEEFTSEIMIDRTLKLYEEIL